MAGMAGRFFEEVHEDPPKVHRREVLRVAAQFPESRRLVGNDLTFSPGRPIEGNGLVQSVAGLYGVVRDLNRSAGEPRLHPGDLGAGHVLDQPEQRGAAPDGRRPETGVVETGSLSNE